MSTLRSRTIGAFIVLVCLILGLLLGGPSVGQQPVAPPAAVGRFQMFVKVGEQNTAVFVLDSHTGQCWFRDANPQVKEWTDMGSPALKAIK